MSVWRNENEAQQPVVRVPFFGAGSNPATLTLNITFVLKIEGMARRAQTESAGNPAGCPVSQARSTSALRNQCEMDVTAKLGGR